MPSSTEPFETLRVSIPKNFLDVITTLVPKLGGSVLIAQEADDDDETIYWEPEDEPDPPAHVLLRGSRYRLDLTQQDVVEGTGISLRRLSEYEQGKRPVPKDDAVKLATFLKTVPEHFYSEND